jgi:subtilisin family serine protease
MAQTDKNLLRKADPQLLRLMATSGQPSAGVIASAFPVTNDPQDIELLVSVVGNQIPKIGLGKWREMADGLYTVIVNRQLVRKLAQSREIESIELPRLYSATTVHSIPALNMHHLHDATLRLTGAGVVIGIIDFDLDFTLPDFRTRAGTRIKWLWDQHLPAEPGERVPSFGYGVEYNEDDINHALSLQNPHQTVRHRARNNHGTLVTGIAASGCTSADEPKRYLGVAPDADLIFVNLGLRRGGTMTGARENVSNSARLADALRYIFEKVDDMKRNSVDEPPPCVVNLSLSQNASAHDGTSFVEREIDTLLDRRQGRAVVVAAGNDAVKNIHADWVYGPDETKDINITVPEFVPGESSCEMEAWYSSRDVIAVSFRRPNEKTFSEPISPPFDGHVTLGTTKMYLLSSRFDSLGGDARIYFSLGEDRTPVPAGDWTARFHSSKESKGGTLDAWIEPRRTPSHFDQDAANAITIGSPATARRCVSVANVDVSGKTSGSSGRGPTRDGRLKPEVGAPGTNITSCDITRTPAAPQRIEVTGTSCSAPHITGLVACLFQADRHLTPVQIQKVLIAASDGTQFDRGRGFGMPDAKKAVELLRDYL